MRTRQPDWRRVPDGNVRDRTWFLTQTATFTGQYGSIFALAIICTILLDVTTQLNIWSIIGVSGMRGQDIANKVVPGLGYFIAFLVSLGGLVFNIGNVGGAATGF